MVTGLEGEAMPDHKIVLMCVTLILSVVGCWVESGDAYGLPRPRKVCVEEQV